MDHLLWFFGLCIAYEPVENNLNINSNINSKAMDVYAYIFFAKKKGIMKE